MLVGLNIWKLRDKQFCMEVASNAGWQECWLTRPDSNKKKGVSFETSIDRIY